jgi:adenine-specific DNA-methyltransferase
MLTTQLPLLEASSRFVAFRPIHYLGSKLRLLSQITAAVDAVAPTGVVCDLFAGSGTVTRAMATRRQVVAVDIQEYSRVLCSALLAPQRGAGHLQTLAERARKGELHSRLVNALENLVRFEDEAFAEARRGEVTKLSDLMEGGSLARAAAGSPAASEPLASVQAAAIARLKSEALWDSSDACVTCQFAGPFFSFRQGIALDAVLGEIHRSVAEERDASLGPLLSTASSIANTIGKQFAQPLKLRTSAGHIKAHLIGQSLADRQVPVWATYCKWADRYASLPPASAGSLAIRADYRDFLDQASAVAVFYADPPYTRDHYSRYYHVLETMCLRDRPTVSTTKIRTGGESRPSRGAYRSNRHQSPFSIKSQAPAAFDALFGGVRKIGAGLVLSYSPTRGMSGGETDGAGRSRVVGIGAVVELARSHFCNVQVQAARGLRHSKLNRRALSTGVAANAEVLITCLP